MRFLQTVLLANTVVCTATAAQPATPSTRPNVVLILADDLGFSDLGCYGGEISTPNLDRLAQSGLRYTQMYNTTRCWPTRACLMTGYYAQQVNRDPPAQRPKWAALLPSLLRPAGYRSYHSGKWHIDGKPVEGGFDRSYWFQDWDRYFTPKEHYLDDQRLPAVGPDEHYYATTAIAQHAIDFLDEHASQHKEQPFFLYLAFIAPHFPLMAPAEDIAKYKDRYLAGWDAMREERWKRQREMGIVECELSARDPKFRTRYFKSEILNILGPGEIEYAAAWKDLTPEQQRFQATKMAIHAAMVDRMDYEIGRVFDQLRKMNAWENTLIVFLSDNGADASILVRGEGHDPSAPMGSAASFLCVGPGWATYSNTPFRRHKIWTHEGGISTPFIVSWPRRLNTAPTPTPNPSPAERGRGTGVTNAAEAGALRHTPAHIIDFVPTVLKLAAVTPPAEWNGAERPPLPGRSLAPTFSADVKIEREFIYWKHEGNHALRIGDWKIVAERERDATWELYNLETDRAEAHDLAGSEPQRVAEMSSLWRRLTRQFEQQGRPGAAPGDASRKPASRGSRAE